VTRVSASYRSVFANGEFRTLFATQLLSVVGDQLARVALAVLVFERTGSPALTAVTYALTFVPDLLGGPLLGGLADRFPRRAVMVVCDLARAGLVALMALPGMPVWAVGVLLVGVQLFGAPFKAARAALLPAVLSGDRYLVADGLMNTTYQLGLLGGYTTGAPLVAWLGTGSALLADAATFVASAALIAAGLRPHPPAELPTRWTTVGSLRAGTRLVGRDRRLRALLGIACLSGFYAVPSGLALPYAAQIGASTAAVGLLLAADPLGSALGAAVLTRLVPHDLRLRLLGPLAVATSAVLLPTALAPGLWVTVVLWTACGLLSGHDAVTAAVFKLTVPAEQRGQAFGLASAALRAAQGFGIALAGLLAEATSPAVAVGLFALIGITAGTAAATAWRRALAAAEVVP
jgi:MFS family permease